MKNVASSAFMVSALLPSVLCVSCGPAGINAGDAPAGSSLGSPCPPSRVTSIPDAGTLRVTMTTDAQITGEQTGLGQAMGVAVLATALSNQPPPAENLIEVGADGSLTDSGGRFAIVDGCLAIVSDEPGDLNTFFNPPTAEDLSQGLFDAPVELLGNCAQGQFPIGPGGVGDTSGSHICIESDATSCVSCDQTPTRWTQSVQVKMTYRALGSLEGVATFDPVANEPARVDIRADDRVTFDFEMLVVYEPVP